MRKIVGCALWILLLAGCAPTFLQKYQKKADVERKDSAAALASPNSELPAIPPGPGETAAVEAPRSENRVTPPAKATIYAVDAQTFRFALNEEQVWDSALQILLKNYSLSIVDRATGVVTTEWDTYYLKQAVYRNKVSLRIKKISREAVEVTMHNSVEKLQDGTAAGAVGSIWLPADDPAGEVARVVQNMALALNQAPPVMPVSMMAKEATVAPKEKSE